ncbi:MAG: ATP-grasp domain-containing protein, partial [Acidimicrobiia bacterium]
VGLVGSEEPQTVAAETGRAVTVPLADPDRAAAEIALLHEGMPLDAVVAADDQGVLAAAAAAERLHLRHNPRRAVAATRDKAALRRALTDTSVPQPRFRIAGPADDVGTMAEEVGLPVVVKPVALSGSRGVIRADAADAAARASTRVRAIVADAGGDPSAPVLIEQYLPGVEVAVEGLLQDGALTILALFDKPDPLVGPYFEETIYVTPSRLPEPVLDRVADISADAARGLGLIEGPIHAELRIDGADVWLLEVAARSIGGLCARALRFGAGVSLEELIVRHALGAPLDGMTREHTASGVMMLPIPRPGTLVRVDGQDAALAVPGIAGLEITIPNGRQVKPLPEGDRYLGFLFARGDTPDAVEGALRAAHAYLEVVIEP